MLSTISNKFSDNTEYAWNEISNSIETPVIRQKGESQNGCFKKTKHAKTSEKRTSYFFSYVCASGLRNVLFSENLACFVFLKHPFWDSTFYLITDEEPLGFNYLMTLSTVLSHFCDSTSLMNSVINLSCDSWQRNSHLHIW